MTPEQKGLIRSSFKQLLPVAGEASRLFYIRLFELDPNLRALFKNSISEQELKFMDMLQIAVYGLDYPEQLLGAVQRLGERHAAYQVRPEHYEVVGAALLWTLEQGLEDDFTAALHTVWLSLYNMLAEIMQQAAARLTNPHI